MTLTARELRDLSAGQISEHVKARDLSASEVVEAALERMDFFEPHIHAFCAPGHDLARASAAALDERISKGEVPGPLAGVPIGIKDLNIWGGYLMIKCLNITQNHQLLSLHQNGKNLLVDLP